MAGGSIGSIVDGILTGGAGPALSAGIGPAILSIAEIARVIVERCRTLGGGRRDVVVRQCRGRSGEVVGIAVP